LEVFSIYLNTHRGGPYLALKHIGTAVYKRKNPDLDL